MAQTSQARLKDRLIEAANAVWCAFMNWGPVDDGSVAGDAFDTALIELRVAAKRSKFQTTAERAALVEIVNQADQNADAPCHVKIKEAIQRAREVIATSDLVVEEES